MYTTFINASRLWLYSKGWEKLWGWDTITITGGEPLMSPIYREACELIAKRRGKNYNRYKRLSGF